MRRNKVGGYGLSWIWSFIFCFKSCMATLPSLGRGRTFVKPTGYARFFVKFIRLFCKTKSLFIRKSIR